MSSSFSSELLTSEIISLLTSSASFPSSTSSEASFISSPIVSGKAPSSKTSSILIVSSSVKFSLFYNLISSPFISISASASVRDTITEIIA